MLHQPSFCKSFHSNWCNCCPSTLQWPLEFPGSRVTKHYHGKLPKSSKKNNSEGSLSGHYEYHIPQFWISVLTSASWEPQKTRKQPLDFHCSKCVFSIPSYAPTIHRSDDSMTQPDASSKWGHAAGACLANGCHETTERSTIPPWNQTATIEETIVLQHNFTKNHRFHQSQGLGTIMKKRPSIHSNAKTHRLKSLFRCFLLCFPNSGGQSAINKSTYSIFNSPQQSGKHHVGIVDLSTPFFWGGRKIWKSKLKHEIEVPTWWLNHPLGKYVSNWESSPRIGWT